ncbi:hypothetical protein BDZ85DRAFT_104840 [Elsinoe ampelina]|uniref:Methyltransferase-domain-containing protein n=1 Tax=Elsinoe ampelina TaxID=302913 RepID=A0A6A6GGJ0_9PEZI|nr:hypothetical protein BDZ85DRAFT_104840 [Elsinoe ampelina]
MAPSPSAPSAPSPLSAPPSNPPSAPSPLPITPVRHFPIPLTPHHTQPILITEPNLRADNLPLETWASSTILASQLHLVPVSFPAPSPSMIPILELGAGTGLVGIAAAGVYRRGTVLTDLEPIVPGLEGNVGLNSGWLGGVEEEENGEGEGTGGGKVEISAGVLDWTAPGICTVGAKVYRASETKAHVILAADTLYSEEHPVLLSRTVGMWLARDSRARFIMGTALRVAYLEELRELWEKLEGLGLKCVKEGKGMAEEKDFDDERLVEWSVWRWKDLEDKEESEQGQEVA